MIDTNKYEGHTCKWCGYVEDTGAWHYEECPIFDDPMMKHHIAEVKRLREELDRVTKQCGALWSITENWSMCEDDYTMHDQYENLDERYAWADWGIILKELYTYTEEDGWQPKEMIE